MPITQSAKKALRQNVRRHERNIAKGKTMKEAIKTFKKSPSREALSRVYQVLDKAAKAKIIEKNKASRLKSQLSKLLNRV
jgi:small subunit ribosomal protein S20